MPGDNPRASVVIPTYNRARILPRAVRSVLNQTFGDFELIVVDDASTDDTEEVVRAIGDARVIYLRQDANRGGAAARDRGIAAARGAYVAFLDDDDEWLPQFLERIDDVFASDPDGEVGVAETGIYQRDGSVHLFEGENAYERLLTLERDICLSSIAVRREALGPDIRFGNPTGYAQDRHFFMEVARRRRFVSIPEPLARIHRASGSHMNTPEVRLTKRVYFFSQHGDELQERPKALARHHSKLGSIYFRLGDHRSARAEFAHAIKARPRDVHWWVWWGVALFGKRGVDMMRILKRARAAVGDLVSSLD